MMQHWRRVVPFLCFLALLSQPGVVAAEESQAVHTMAAILLTLNHYPSAADKEALQKIVSDQATSAQERVLAQALSNVQHTASASDKPKLHALMQDEAAPASLRTLASILSTLNHTPSDTDKEQLKQLLS
jgi:hypothetical protein